MPSKGALEQGSPNKAAIGSMNQTTDRMINTAVVLVTHCGPKGEMAAEY